MTRQRSALLEAVVGSYDVRGRVGEDLRDDVVFALGWATGQIMHEVFGTRRTIVGHDMRTDSKRFAAILVHGLREAGYQAIALGLCSTDQLYFASGMWNLPGLMVTASHNPADYNGIKACGPAARGISQADVLGQISQRALLAPAYANDAEEFLTDTQAATEVRAEFAHTVRQLSGLNALPGHSDFSAVADCGNGMAGKLIAEVFGSAAGLEKIPLHVDALYPELDGTFPNHPANPLDPANLEDVIATVKAGGYSLGLAFDGDADRCFFIDENGRPASASAVGALVATREISRAQQQGEAQPLVLHNALTTMSVPTAITSAGGLAMRTPVGHSGIKQLMRTQGALFAVEHSAHFYFRDFYCADSGILAACHVMAALLETGHTLAELLAPFSPASTSGEINSAVADPLVVIDRVRTAAQAGEFGSGSIDELDGLTFRGEDYWFNVRKSNTEPLVRFNAETQSADHTARLTEQVLGLIRA